MMKVPGKTLILLTASTILAGTAAAQTSAPPSAAPENQAGLEDIVVTARRQAENLQDVPLAVTAITGSSLADRGIFETSDLSSSVPSLQVNSVYGAAQPNFTLRGIGVANEFNSNAASPVGVYVDEVYQAIRASHGQQLFDLDRVEVLRGPQGTLYGRNTTGGAINFITVQPSLSDPIKGYVTVGYGNFDRRNIEGAAEATLVPDRLGVRLAGTYVNSDPYIRNLAGRDGGGPESYGIRGTIRFRSPVVDLSVKGYAAKTKGAQDQIFPANDRPGNTGPITFGGFGQAFGLSYDRSGLDDRTVEADSTGLAIIEARGIVVKATFDLSSTLSLTSLSGYDSGSYRQTPGTDCDGTPFDLCNALYESRWRSANQEIRLNFSTSRLKAVGGFYYGWDRLNVANDFRLYGILDDFRTGFGLPATYFNPLGFGVIADPTALPTPILTDMRYSQTRRSRAAFAEVVYDATDRLSLTIGLRYTRDSNHYFNGTATLFDSTGVARLVSVSAVDGLVPAGAGVVPLERRARSKALSGRGVISYKPVDDVMLYTSYSRGYRAGSFNGTAFQSNEQVSFVPPEKVNAYEAGIKSRLLDNRLQANVALFYYDYKGQQVQQIVGARSLTALSSLDGTLKGIEAELEYRPVADLHLMLSGGYLDSRYDEGQFLSGISVGGNRFPSAPKTSLNAGFDWDVLRFGADSRLTLHGDTSYVGKFTYDPFGDRQATGILAQGGGDYWLVNGRLTMATGNLTLSAWVKNLTDKLYYPMMLNLEAGYGIDELIRGMPRTYGVEAKIRF
jgi:iron complex outermembrane receptor protein